MKTPKKRFEMAAKTSISMPRVMLDRAQQRQSQTGMGTFSDYIQSLIREDLQRTLSVVSNGN